MLLAGHLLAATPRPVSALPHPAWTPSAGSLDHQLGLGLVNKRHEPESEGMDGEGRVFVTPPPCLPGFRGLAVYLHLRPSSCQGPSPFGSSHLSSLSCLLHLHPEPLFAVLPLTCFSHVWTCLDLSCPTGWHVLPQRHWKHLNGRFHILTQPLPLRSAASFQLLGHHTLRDWRPNLHAPNSSPRSRPHRAKEALLSGPAVTSDVSASPFKSCSRPTKEDP